MIMSQVGTIDSLKQINWGTASEAGNPTSPFKDILQNAIDSVNETDAKVKADELAVATGRSDDLHTLMIDAAKANLALETLVQIRNKALDAYNEIMRITL